MSALESEVEKKKENPKLKTHTRYYIGKKRLPSVATILGIGNMGGKWNALMAWQKRLLLSGDDPDKVRDEAADIGTLAHAMIEEYLTSVELDLSFYSESVIEKATVAFDAYLDWESQHKIRVIAVEQILTHTRLRYGGTADLVCEINDKFSLVDFKSSNYIYLDHKMQLSAYQELVKQKHGYIPETWILHLGKETPSFADHYYPDLSKEWKAFRLLLKLYQLNKELK